MATHLSTLLFAQQPSVVRSSWLTNAAYMYHQDSGAGAGAGGENLHPQTTTSAPFLSSALPSACEGPTDPNMLHSVLHRTPVLVLPLAARSRFPLAGMP